MNNYDATEIAYKNGYEAGKRDALAKDNNVPSKWIPVTERLPKAHKLVLCLWVDSKGNHYGFARYQHDDVWYVSNEGMPEVTHWMPLPEPPKGE